MKGENFIIHISRGKWNRIKRKIGGKEERIEDIFKIYNKILGATNRPAEIGNNSFCALHTFCEEKYPEDWWKKIKDESGTQRRARIMSEGFSASSAADYGINKLNRNSIGYSLIF